MSFLSWCMRACEQLPQEGAEFLALCVVEILAATSLWSGDI